MLYNIIGDVTVLLPVSCVFWPRIDQVAMTHIFFFEFSMESNVIWWPTAAKIQEENTPRWGIYTSISIYGLNSDG